MGKALCLSRVSPFTITVRSGPVYYADGWRPLVELDYRWHVGVFIPGFPGGFLR